jgi:Transmembrane secretion effector
MVEIDRQLDEQENISASGLSPFRSSLYRNCGLLVLFSYIGGAMYDVGASWLMTSLAPKPLFVSLITTVTLKKNR